MRRRERTRHLIELGGLVQKAGLVELTDDDRGVLLGAFLAIAAKLQGDEREQTITLWRRRGKRAFEDDDEFNTSRLAAFTRDPSGNFKLSRVAARHSVDPFVTRHPNEAKWNFGLEVLQLRNLHFHPLDRI
jgi:Conjugal transfer protein TraD